MPNQHDKLVEFISDKYYKGGMKDDISKKILSDQSAYNKALEAIHKDKYGSISYDDFKAKYESKYGNPYEVKKKSVPETPYDPSQDVLLNQLQAGSETQSTPSGSGSSEYNRLIFDKPEFIDNTVASESTGIAPQPTPETPQQKRIRELEQIARNTPMGSGIPDFSTPGVDNTVASESTNVPLPPTPKIEEPVNIRSVKDFKKGENQDKLSEPFSFGKDVAQSFKNIVSSNKQLPKKIDLFIGNATDKVYKSLESMGVNTSGLQALTLANQIGNLYEIDKEAINIKPTSSIVDAIEEGNVRKTAAAIVGGVFSLSDSMVKAIATGGTSVFAQAIADNYYNTLQETAELAGTTPLSIIMKDEDKELVPLITGTISGALEKIGLDKVGATWLKKAPMGVWKKVIEVAKTSGVEGTTEALQEVTDQVGTRIANGKNIDVAWREVLESGLIGLTSGGVMGGAGSAARGRGANTESNIETVPIPPSPQGEYMVDGNISDKDAVENAISEGNIGNVVINNDPELEGKLIDKAKELEAQATTQENAEINEQKADIERRRQEELEEYANDIVERVEDYEVIDNDGDTLFVQVRYKKDGSKEVLTGTEKNNYGNVAKAGAVISDTFYEDIYEKVTKTGERTGKEANLDGRENKINAKYDAELEKIGNTAKKESKKAANERPKKTEINPGEERVVVEDGSKEPDSKRVGDKANQGKTIRRGNNEYTVKKEGNHLFVYDKEGNEPSVVTQRKVLRQYEEEFDYTEGEVSKDPDGDIALDINMIDEHVAENSNNPAEIAETWQQSKAYQDTEIDYKTQIISDNLPKIGRQSFIDNVDKNEIRMSIAKTYLRKDGVPMDAAAQELSEIAGIEITEQDIWEYMQEYPNGYKSIKHTEGQKKLQDKFSELTGLELNQRTANLALKSKAKKEQIEYENYINQEFYEQAQAELEFYNKLKTDEKLQKEYFRQETPKREPEASSPAESQTEVEQREGRGEQAQRGPISERFRAKNENQEEVVKEIQSLPLTHVSGLNMGANQAKGTYVSTEPINRYKDQGGQENTVEVSIEKPFVFESEDGIVEYRNDLLNSNLDKFEDADFVSLDKNSSISQGELSIDDLSDAGIIKLAEMVSNQLTEDGYDSIYFRESPTQEGELVVFDKSKVKLTPVKTSKGKVDKAKKDVDEQKKKAKAPPTKKITFKDPLGITSNLLKGEVVSEEKDVSGKVVAYKVKAEDGTNYTVKAKDIVEGELGDIESKILNISDRSSDQYEDVETQGPTLGAPKVKKQKQNQSDLNEKVRFKNNEAERRFTEASKETESATGGKISRAIDKVKDIISGFKNHYKNLDARQFGFVANSLRVFESSKGYTNHLAHEYVKGIIDPLTKEQKSILERRIILEDILGGIESGLETEGALPFGFQTKAEIESEIENLKSLMEAEPEAKRSYDERQKFMENLHEKLVDAGFVAEKEGDYKTYFHRRVLEYQVEEISNRILGGRKLTKAQRDFMKARTGTGGKDFSTNFVESEFKVVSDALYELNKKATMDKILDPYKSRLNDLNKQANKAYHNALQEINDNFGENSKESEAFVREKKSFISRYIDNNKPEGYVLWQPDPGNRMFKEESITRDKLEKIVESALGKDSLANDTLGIIDRILESTSSKIVLGPKKQEYLVPEPIARTIDEIGRPTPAPDGIEGFARSVTTAWKVFVLLNPRRIAKYNLNNMVGDADGVLAADPTILKHSRRAWTELIDYVQTGRVTPMINEAIKQGVIDSGYTINEFKDINSAKWVQYFKDPKKFTLGDLLTKEGLKNISNGKNIIGNYFELAQKLSGIRENWLRLAAFMRANEKISKGENFNWASDARQLEGITDINERAGKLAREVLGDYGNISHTGQYIRRHLIPFYSWMEINMSRYYRLVKNAHTPTDKGRIAGVLVKNGITKAATKATIAYAQMFALSSAVTAWNKLMFPDEEEELRLSNTRGLQVILGKNDDGTINTLPIVGALYDALDFFGLPDITDEMFSYFEDGRKDQLKEAAKHVATSPLDKVFQGLNPLIKAPIEISSGMNFYPSIFNPRPISDRKEYVAQMFSAKDTYRALARKPNRMPYFSEQRFTSMILQELRPKEFAYYGVLNKLSELKNTGSYFGSRDKKKEALYNYKLSLRYNNIDDADKFLTQYYDLGGTYNGLQSSIRASHPLRSLNKEEKQDVMRVLNGAEPVTDVVKQLTKSDLKRIEMALEFYEFVYLSE